MIKVKILTAFATKDRAYTPGLVLDMPDDIVKSLEKAKLVKIIEPEVKEDGKTHSTANKRAHNSRRSKNISKD